MKGIRLIFVLAIGALLWTSHAEAAECQLAAGQPGEQCSFECSGGQRMSVGISGLNVGIVGQCNGELDASCEGALGCMGNGRGPGSVSGVCTCETYTPGGSLLGLIPLGGAAPGVVVSGGCGCF